MTQADKLNANPMPLAKLMGVTVVEASPERVVTRMVVREDLCTAGGILHGGAFMALADTTGAIGAFLALPEGAGTTTIESKTNFLGGAPVGAEITAEATPLHRGRRTSVWQTRITNDAGKLLAMVTQTQMTL